jgi:hypothetical protein
MPESETTAVARARLVMRQPAHEPEQEAKQPAARVQRDPLAHVGSRAGDAMAGVHASILSRATDGRPGRAAGSLLRLQRTYGNRHVSRVVDLSRKGQGEGDVTPEIEADIQRERGGGQALDSGARARMEPALGADFSGVRVHTGRQADVLNRDLSARAFTTGQDIFFKEGEYRPGSSSGQELLAHELTHVVQQNEGVRRSKAPDEEPEDQTGGKVLAKPDAVQRGEAPDEEPEEETGGKLLAKPIQAKLTVGAADDQYEQEADRTAGQVMRTLQQGAQRQPELDEDKDKLQAKHRVAGGHVLTRPDSGAARADQIGLRDYGRVAQTGVIRLLNSKQKKLLDAIVFDPNDTPEQRWDRIKAALDAESAGTDKNVADGARYLKVIAAVPAAAARAAAPALPNVTIPAQRPTRGGMVEEDARTLAAANNWVLSTQDWQCTDRAHTPKGSVYEAPDGFYYGADKDGHVGWGFKVWTKKDKTTLVYNGNRVWDGTAWVYRDRGT